MTSFWLQNRLHDPVSNGPNEPSRPLTGSRKSAQSSCAGGTNCSSIVLLLALIASLGCPPRDCSATQRFRKVRTGPEKAMMSESVGWTGSMAHPDGPDVPAIQDTSPACAKPQQITTVANRTRRMCLASFIRPLPKEVCTH